MLRAASKPLARYPTLGRYSSRLNTLRLYTVETPNPSTEAVKPVAEATEQPIPSGSATPSQNASKKPKRSSKKKTERKTSDSDYVPVSQRVAAGRSLMQINMEKTRSAPTLKDLMDLKPAVLPDPSGANYIDRYRRKYDKLRRAVDRAFTERQIRRFLKELDPTSQSLPITKSDSIVFLFKNHWDMPPPQPSTKERPLPTQTTEVPLGPERLVILLGRNGEGLQNLAKQFKVKIRPLPARSAIEVTGKPDQISAVRLHLNQIRRRTTGHMIKLTLENGVRPQLLQEISKRSGAYVEARGVDQIYVSADSTAKHQSAVRLINQACFDEANATQVPRLIDSETTSTESYAPFPFLSSQTLPWTVGQSVSRVRRVGGLLNAGDADGSDAFILSETPENVRSTLLKNLPPLPKGYIRSIEARTGHILTAMKQGSSLPESTSPAPSAQASFEVTSNGNTRTFVPSTSPIDSSSKTSQRKYQLVYQTAPGQETVRSQLVVEFSLEENRTLDVKCRLGKSSRVDLACPDRALDMSFTAFDYKYLLDADVPSTIKRFAKQLMESEKLEDIPMPDGLSSVELASGAYHLQSASLVQIKPSSHGRASTELVTEMDSKITTATALVQCGSPGNEAKWQAFVEQCAKAVSQPFYRPQAKFIPYRPTLVDA